MPLTISPAQVERNPRNIRLFVFFPEPVPRRRRVVSQPLPHFDVTSTKAADYARTNEVRPVLAVGRRNQLSSTRASPTRNSSSGTGGRVCSVRGRGVFAGAGAESSRGMTMVIHITNQNNRVY